MLVEEAAKYVGLSRSTMYRYERKGILVPKRLEPRGDRWYFKEQLDEFIINLKNHREYGVW
jgi:DNA-binding transcriptional MerR regulator